MTKQQKKALQERLIKRWTVVIQEDVHTDGFYETMAEVLGVEVSDLTNEQNKFASAVVSNAVAWLQRTPEVK